MRPSILLTTILLAPAATAVDTSPFYPPWDAETVNKRAADVLKVLQRRDNCPSGYNPCTDLGDSGACCRDGTICSRDAADNIACCPTRASCTGSLTGSATGSIATDSTSSGFMFPQPTSASTTETSTSSGASITGSTVSGAAYPFVYIPTTFANAATCSSYYSQCQRQYSSCTTSLGGANGVTVGGSGGGITVQGATATSDAKSICSSLSREACYGLQVGYCTAFGTAGGTTAGATGNQFINPSDAAPMRSSTLYDLAVALAVGITGMFV